VSPSLALHLQLFNFVIPANEETALVLAKVWCYYGNKTLLAAEMRRLVVVLLW
jgi:hypothetical protein